MLPRLEISPKLSLGTSHYVTTVTGSGLFVWLGSIPGASRHGYVPRKDELDLLYSGLRLHSVWLRFVAATLLLVEVQPIPNLTHNSLLPILGPRMHK